MAVILPILLFLFMGLVCAYAEVALVKAPLSWYEGGGGDYALPKLANAEYGLSGFMATAGQVKTICANYDAAGKVAMEVSVDNGLHYYRIINGVPLTENFVSGDRIKWRAKVLDEDSKLNALNITYTDSAGTVASFGRPELSGFNYRKKILLKNPSGQELFNYQINLKVGIDKKAKGADVHCEGNVRQDFLDVRFTAADGETALGYYLDPRFRGDDKEKRGDDNRNSPPLVGGVRGGGERGDDNQIVSFWVKVPQIPVNGVAIYMYYGNPDAADLSNPKAVFDFYDSFNNPELDANSWVVKTDPKGSVVIKAGQLKLDAAEIIAKDFKFNQGIVEYAVRIESGFDNSLNLRPKAGDSYDNPGLVVYSSAYKGAEHCIALDDIVKANDAKASLIAAGGKYNYRLTVNDKDITFERIDQATAAAQAKVTYSGASVVKAGYLGLKSGGDGSGRNVIAYSGIRARKFASNGPQVDKTGAQEQVKLPIFSNIALSQKSRLILSDNTKEGVYIGKAIPAAFTARIIVPTFKGANAGVGVSADNGLNYKEDCVSTNYYYASKKDFPEGQSLKWRLKLSPQGKSAASSQLQELGLDYRPGKISLITPDGKQNLVAGENYEITWSALEYELSYKMKLEYTLDAGKTYNLIVQDTGNSGSYFWSVPNKLSPKVAVKISDSLNGQIEDTSTKSFSIVESLKDAKINSRAEANNEQIQPRKEAVKKTKPVEKQKTKSSVEQFDVDKLIKAGKRPGTRLYELLIKLGDNYNPNAEEDARSSYKEGDVVMIKPAGYIWGAEERKNFLIPRVYLTVEEAETLTKPKEAATGDIDELGRPMKKIVQRRAKRIDMQKLVPEKPGDGSLKNKRTVPFVSGMIKEK
ncbi:MAG: DUF2341 domain-containing protein [Candidatus Omnitrophica bacterium]|nr:DUF2341 domain-containing protein [Candidatus Omnitrophota bacterium]